MNALVTGAAGGIGAAVVRVLRRDGFTVFGCDLAGADFEVDVRSSAAVDAFLRDLGGPVDVLVNVAGVLHSGAVLDTTDDEWRAVFEVNAMGVFRVSRAVGALMARRGSGSIITVASNAAGVPRMSMAAYAASKAAAAHFTRCLGLELAAHGVRCNVVSPGSTDTGMLRGLGGDPVAGSPEHFKVRIPLGRIAQPSDVAEAVAFLASDRARHITMHELYVDGGASL